MSHFVSAGTGEDPPQRDAEWLEAQKEIEAAQLRRKEAANADDGRSLFEVLQANKAAKQEAFEEAAKLKNQFRSLDDDEVDFLDSVLESTRAREEAVKKETTEQLELFRQQREEAAKADLGLRKDAEADTPIEEEQWTASGARKRKKGPEKAALKGLKVRRSSSNPEGKDASLPSGASSTAAAHPQKAPKVATVTKDVASRAMSSTAPASKPPGSKALGLAAYSDTESD